MKRMKRCAGFALLELLVAVAVLLGLLSLAAPSVADLLQSMRSRSAAEALLSALNLSRAAAVQHNARVALCKSANASTCSDAQDWAQGWIVFYDDNNSGTHEEGEAVIYRQEALSGAFSIIGNGPVAQYVSYTPLGQAKLLNGGGQAGTFTVCSNGAEHTTDYQVVVAASGRARMAKASADQCR